MSPRWTWLLLPYTRTESPGWGPLLTWAGARGPRSNPAWKRVAHVTVRGKSHHFLMRLDRSNWSHLVLNFTSEHSGTATLAPVGSEILRSIVVDVRIGDRELGEAPRMIKLDVEGYELHALRGLASTIEMHKPCILMEVVATQLQRAGTRVADLQDFMFDRGYAAFGIGSARRFWRHRLRLRPVPRGAGFDGFSDVLWIHADDPTDVRRHVG